MKRIVLTSLLVALLTSCSLLRKSYTPQEIESETKKFNAFLERVFEENVSRSPTSQTYIGRKTNYDKLDNETIAFQEEGHELTLKNLKELKTYNYDALNEQGKISYKILKDSYEKGIEGYKYRYHGFPLNQMFGYHSSTPSFLINMHSITNEEEAMAYISRLKEIKRVFAERMIKLKIREELGISPPAFVFPKVIQDSTNVITGRPFTESSKDSTLLADFKKKVEKLKMSEDKKKRLINEAVGALNDYVKPAYKELIVYVDGLKNKITENKGAWALPDGKDYYNFRLKRITTTDMTANEIHDLGLKEVSRIHKEMELIKDKVGFKGDLKQFFHYVKTDEKFIFPNTKSGRKQYLEKATQLIADMEKQLPKMFNTFPKARVKVKAVEKYREKSAGIAFYEGPSLEGDRPGVYYVNLYEMKDNPKYKMEALAYHEGIPGHHMQIAISTELKELPRLRRLGGYGAYSEGWGLYSEYLPKEFGFYSDPYSDFGRLSMELWRACRLVVDTGIHSKKWTREEAIKYLTENTPNAELEIVKGVERYFVMPGQATAYKIGMLKILELREKAKRELGEKFDIRDFHDVVLRSGALPLEILQEQVENWTETKKYKL